MTFDCVYVCMYIICICVLLCILYIYIYEFLSLVSQPETNNLGEIQVPQLGFTFDIHLHHLRGSDKCRCQARFAGSPCQDLNGSARICQENAGFAQDEHLLVHVKLSIISINRVSD